MSAHWDEDERARRRDPARIQRLADEAASEEPAYAAASRPVPRREITDEMVKARVRQERAKREFEEARAALEELERPERERRETEDELIRRANHARLEEFSKRLQVLCTEFQVQILSDEEYDAYVVIARTGTGRTEAASRIYSNGTIYK